jgi:hypothetical protein
MPTWLAQPVISEQTKLLGGFHSWSE